MNCTECKEKLAELLEGLLPESQKQAVEEHLEGCPLCQSEWQELNKLKERLSFNSKAWHQTSLEDEVLNRIIRRQNEKLKQADKMRHQLRIWRQIMRSKITRYATVAVIIIAVIIGINQFGGKVGVTTIAFAEISEAMKNVSWMHQVSKGFERGINGKGEQWFGFEAKIFASKPADDKPVFIDMKEQKGYTYDPKNQTITIGTVDNFPLDLSSPMTMLDSMSKLFQEQGAKILVKETKYSGQKVQLQEISLSVGKNKNENQILRLYIQPKSKLLVGAEVKGTKANGEVVMDGEITFTYPQTGPSSIYDLGVPRDAKIVNNSKKVK